jgi:moderate conductance mechanosensitive channel
MSSCYNIYSREGSLTMNFTVFLSQTATNILYTSGIVVFIVIFLLLEKLLLKKDEKIKGWVIFIVYFITFIILLSLVLLIFHIWGFDLVSYATTTLTDLGAILANSIGRIVSSLIILFTSFFISKFSKKGFKTIGSKEGPTQKRKKTIGKLLSSVTRYTISIIAILILLSIWGVDVGPALAGLGIAGLVIGLGAQKFINDLISGFFIIFEQHYDVDDVIEVQGFKGVVTEIGLKTTRIRNWKGDVKILANGDITNLTNHSKNASLAIVDFGIAYEEDIQKTFDLLSEKLPLFKKDHPEAIEDPQNLGVVALSSSSVDMKVICKTFNEQHYGVERALRKYIKDILDEADIEIPFPQVVVSKKGE